MRIVCFVLFTKGGCFAVNIICLAKKKFCFEVFQRIKAVFLQKSISVFICKNLFQIRIQFILNPIKFLSKSVLKAAFSKPLFFILKEYRRKMPMYFLRQIRQKG
jgi:hypothetical protein